MRANHVAIEPSLAGRDVSWRHYPGLVCEHDRLDPVTKAELHQDALYMRLNGAPGDDELIRDLAVRQAPRDESQHLALARRQLLESGRWSSGCRRTQRERLDQASGHLGREERIAGGDDAYGPYKLLGWRVLQQKATCARMKRPVYVLVDVERRDDQDPRGWRRAIDHGARRGYAVQSRHLDIHHEHVRVEPGGLGDRGLAVRRLAHDVDVILRLEDHREPCPDHLLVVGHHHADRHQAASIGSRACTANRSRSSGPAVSSPP